MYPQYNFFINFLPNCHHWLYRRLSHECPFSPQDVIHGPRKPMLSGNHGQDDNIFAHFLPKTMLYQFGKSSKANFVYYLGIPSLGKLLSSFTNNILFYRSFHDHRAMSEWQFLTALPTMWWKRYLNPHHLNYTHQMLANLLIIYELYLQLVLSNYSQLVIDKWCIFISGSFPVKLNKPITWTIFEGLQNTFQWRVVPLSISHL